VDDTLSYWRPFVAAIESTTVTVLSSSLRRLVQHIEDLKAAVDRQHDDKESK
jgi:hypothetical protein